MLKNWACVWSSGASIGEHKLTDTITNQLYTLRVFPAMWTSDKRIKEPMPRGNHMSSHRVHLSNARPTIDLLLGKDVLWKAENYLAKTMGVGMSELLLGHIVKNISCLVQREVFQGIFFQILHGFNHFLIAVSQLLGGGGAYPRRPHVCMYVNLSAVVQSNQILKPMVVKIDKELTYLNPYFFYLPCTLLIHLIS